MKKKLLIKSITLIFSLFLGETVYGQGVPELLYYRFNEKDTVVTNLAGSPPSGASVAYLKGGYKQSGTGTCGETSLLGTGAASSADFVDTKWTTKLSGSWTISFWTDSIGSSSTLFYIFGDNTANSFRCFTNGVAGANNWMLRGGGLLDVLLNGGAISSPTVSTFVYDSAASTVYAYLNGKLINSVAQTAAISLSGTASFKVGGYGTNVGLPKGGLMDEFRFYTRALTATEVAKLRYTGSSSGNVNLTVCNSGSIQSPSGKYTWTKPGTYYDTIPNFVNCDSFMTINLQIKNASSSTISPVACDGYLSPNGKTKWTKSGVYTAIIKNSAGCDSTITINLTINESSVSSITVKECNSYTSPSGQFVWTNSGTYTDYLQNKVGCDSVITIDLTINHPSSSSINVTECNKYLSPSGKYIWTKSGKYSDTIPNFTSCDSVMTINLEILNKSASTINVSTCDNYFSPSGKYQWQKSGVYADTLVNSENCDSIITINLSIRKSSSSSFSMTSCNSFTSPSLKNVWNVSGVFFDTVQNYNGCDSFISINLTINKASKATETKQACVGYHSKSGKYYWTETGIYNDTIQNVSACDSIITTNLYITKVNIGVTHDHNTLTANAIGAAYQWLDCANGYNPLAAETKQKFKATVNGHYAVLVTENNCSDTSICYTISTTGVKADKAYNQFSIYPNPSDGYFIISAVNDFMDAEVTIYNLTGELIEKMDNLNGKKADIDFCEKDAGIYFIQLLNAGKLNYFKVVKY